MFTSQGRSTRVILGAAAAATALLLSACGSTSSDEAAASDESYTVQHAMGETTIEGTPERIVVIDSPHLDALVALGITPVGATESGAATGVPAYLADDLEGTEIVGPTMEPDLEAIASLNPDLIIGAQVRHEALYEQLSAIAPTVFSVNSGTDWEEQARITLPRSARPTRWKPSSPASRNAPHRSVRTSAPKADRIDGAVPPGQFPSVRS